MEVFFILAIVFFILWMVQKNKNKKIKISIAEKDTELEKVNKNAEDLAASLRSAIEDRDRLTEKYSEVINAAEEADRIRASAKADAESKRQAAQMVEERAAQTERLAQANADKIIAEANEQAKEIAGSAIDAKNRAEEYTKTAAAMKRMIEGYGDEWLKPAYSLLDEIAAEYGFTEAGQKLKEAREQSARMVKNGIAANCEYVENERRTTAINFVIDAFNGKVDSILSRVKSDNYGILEQKIKDAYQLVNRLGAAFRNAHILPAYLNARLDELKWATVVQELKKKDAEEQKALREKMREEEKVRRELERAQKEAAKEEAMLQKAMEKARAMLATANEAQRAQYEAQLAELGEKLKAAEEKNQRALSMAQQTKHGTVYVISNIGSFGENVYKVGMTRRLDPQDRVRELGDASVPFPFDVHAFIESEDAPALETELHRDLAMAQMNKVNPRKEFFKVDLSFIRKLVEQRGLDANWTISAQAAEYRESMAIEERIKNDPSERLRWEKFMEEASDADSDKSDDT